MGREVRKVPAGWQHPKHNGRYVSLYDGEKYNRRLLRWDEEHAKWEEGFRADFSGGWTPLDMDEFSMSYAEWAGERLDARDYMPVWTQDEATHYMMYETCSEGTPISPAFATPEELAHWLADTGASAFGNMTADYEHWLRVAKGGFAPSAIMDSDGTIQSGVSAAILE